MAAPSQAPSNLLTEWSRLFVHSLAQAGIRDVVISPGSRSTPLTWAFSEHPEIKIVSLIDERSAAFFALGQAKYTGRPTAVVCTSGSAPAHYLPAVIEADLAAAPLILISADRPIELQQCSAPQTVDQVKLYGDFARAFFDLGMPDAALVSLRALRRTALQAVTTSLGPLPGPVHLDFRARKPLEPIVATDSVSRELSERVQALMSHPARVVAPGLVEPDASQIDFLATRCAASKRGVITLGPFASSLPALGPALLALLEVAPFTLFCEATSQVRLSLPSEISAHRICDAFDLLYSSKHALDFAPDLVLQIGAPPTSGAWERFLGSTEACELHVIAEHGWPDPASRATSLTRASLPVTLERLAAKLGSQAVAKPAGSAWHERAHTANLHALAVVEAELDAARSKVDLDEALAVRAIVEALPRGTLLALGNSLAVREVDTVLPAGDRGITVWSQRGANGIDGLVSGASGAAGCHQGPCLLLLGDISFLHDIGGLWAARFIHSPLVIAVLNNGGGRIFEQLPLLQLPELKAERRDLWLTPQDLELTRAAELYGIRGVGVRTLPELQSALATALSHAGATLLDIGVTPHSAVLGRKSMLRELDRVLDVNLRSP